MFCLRTPKTVNPTISFGNDIGGKDGLEKRTKNTSILICENLVPFQNSTLAQYSLNIFFIFV